MDLSEFQQIFIICSVPSFAICFLLFLLHKNSPTPNQPSALRKVVTFVLLATIFLELIRGILHLFYPYKSHTVVSGLAHGFGIEANQDALTAMALVTSQLGSVNLTLGVFLMTPFILGDATLSLSLYMFVVKLVVKVFAMLNLRYSWFNDVRGHVPEYLKEGYENMESARKLPPGKLVHMVEIVLLIGGIAAAVVERRRSNSGEKKKE